MLYKIYPNGLTARELALELGLKRQQVADLISRWHVRGYGYTRRKKVKGSKAYSHIITKTGTIAMLRYQKRIESSMSLNLRTSKKEDQYIGIGRHGVESGLTYEKVLNEMKRRKDSKNVDN